jgi:PST family polysaccharide transporter
MPERARRSLDAALVKGVAWTGAASWVAQALTWVSTLVVVRILTPDDYGLVALAGVYLGFASLLSEFGIGTAVVTIRGLSPGQTAQLNTVALMLAGVAVVISWTLAGLVSEFFVSPRLADLIRVMSAAVVLASLSSVSAALLQKALRFRFLAGAQVVQSLSAATTTLLVALLGGGYWALAIGPLVGQGVMSALVVGGAPCGYAWPVWHSLRPVLRFSRHVIVERLCWYVYTGSDKLVIGKWIGEVAVGLYSIGSTFGMMAVEKVTTLMLRVAPAVLSEVQTDPASLRRYLLSMTEGLAILTFPISIGLALVAEDLVLLAFGAQWQGAIGPLQVLGVFGAYQSVTALLSRVLAAVGDVRYAMHVAMLALGIMPIAFIVGSHWGLVGVAMAWLIAYPFTQAPMYVRLHHRIQLTAAAYLQSLWPAVSAVLLMAAVVWLLQQWPPADALPRAARLALTVCVGAITYTLAMLLFHSGRIRRFRQLTAEIRLKRETPREEPAS